MCAKILGNGTIFYGAGETFAVADTGFDTKVPATTHPVCADYDMILLLVSCKEASDT